MNWREARSNALKATDRPGSVVVNTRWMAECPKHGLTEHLSVIGGNCTVCQIEKLEAAGLVSR